MAIASKRSIYVYLVPECKNPVKRFFGRCFLASGGAGRCGGVRLMNRLAATKKVQYAVRHRDGRVLSKAPGGTIEATINPSIATALSTEGVFSWHAAQY